MHTLTNYFEDHPVLSNGEIRVYVYIYNICVRVRACACVWWRMGCKRSAVDHPKNYGLTIFETVLCNLSI
jgi:hypothetical protein